MNKSVYIILLTTALLFFIGFVLVSAMNRTVLTPIKLGASLNSKTIELKDSISVYPSDVLTLEHIKKTGDESLTEWKVNGESVVLNDELEYSFKESGVFVVSAANSKTEPFDLVVTVESPEEATLSLLGGPNFRQGQVCNVSDDTPNVQSRQWRLNGNLIEDEETESLSIKLFDSGLQKIKVISRLENGKIAMGVIEIDVASVQPKVAKTVSNSGGGGGGGGGGASTKSSGMTLTNRLTNIGYSLNTTENELSSLDSEEGKRLVEATLTATSKVNLTQFAVKGKNNKGKITLSVLDKNGDILETREVNCKPQNLYFSLNDGAGIDVNANDLIRIWIQLSDGAEIYYVPNGADAGFTPYPGFDLKFEKELSWMFDLEVWTP